MELVTVKERAIRSMHCKGMEHSSDCKLMGTAGMWGSMGMAKGVLYLPSVRTAPRMMSGVLLRHIARHERLS